MTADEAAWLMGLYPAAWRRRYGAEFAALLEERPITPGLVFDVVMGALDARVCPQVSDAGAAPTGIPGKFLMPFTNDLLHQLARPWFVMRAGALATVIGSVLMVAAIVVRGALGPPYGWPTAQPGYDRLYDPLLLNLYELVLLGVVACLAITLFGLYARLGERAAEAGALGVVLCGMGGLTLVVAACFWAVGLVLRTEVFFVAHLGIAGLFVGVGHLSLGVAALRDGSLPWWARPLPLTHLVVRLPVAIVSAFASDDRLLANPLILGSLALTVAIWLALGYLLWTGRPHARWPTALTNELSWVA